MSKVLKVDAAAAGTLEEDFGSNYSEVWLYADVALDAAALADLLAGVGSDYYPMQIADHTTGRDCGIEWYITAGPVANWAAWNSPGTAPRSAVFAPTPALASMRFYRMKLHVIAGTPITQEIWIDGVSIGTVNVTSTNLADNRFLDLYGLGLAGGFMYFDNIKVGTTDGGTDVFSDDLEGGDLSNWTTVGSGFTVVDDPGITPAGGGGGGGGPPAALTIKIYDLGVTELADISSIALEKSLIRQLNGPRGFTVTAPAGHPLLTAIADDTYPNLRRFNRKLVVWEDSDPVVDDPIFHGRIFITERDGDENSVHVKITAYDPWMELGFDADNRAGRLVRDSSTTTFGDPSFLSPEFTSSVEGQDEISGPDLMRQMLTYSQADPTTNPIQGEGPLPIDLVSGTWDLDVPPAIDLNPVDSADWPQLVGDFFNQLIQSGAVDLDMRPVRPGTGHNLDDDPDDYIMVEASAKSKIGTDRSATVHFDYLTGDHNAARCKLIEDGSTICQRLWYELGPRLSRQHWRGDITPHSTGQLGDASAAIYGGPGDVKGYFVSTRIFDSLGSETSSRPLYTALYMDEVGLRRESRDFLYITPASDDKALFDAPQQFDAFDVIAINVGPGFGIELADAQRVFGYTKTWSRENVARLGQLVTSADYSPGNE